MDLRFRDSLRIQFEARVAKLSNPEVFALGPVSEISESGISVNLPLQFATGELVQVEMADSVLLGHVLYSNQEGSLFRTRIDVEKVRLGTTGLSHLLQRILLESMPGIPGLEPTETHPC